MIQRKQSLLLILVILVIGLLNYLVPLNQMFTSIEQVKGVFHESVLKESFVPASYAVAVLAFVELLLFSNRNIQLTLGKLGTIINIYLVGVIVYWSLKVSGGVFTPEKGIWILGLLLNICLLAISNKWIRRDENLVKSVDRIR